MSNGEEKGAVDPSFSGISCPREGGGGRHFDPFLDFKNFNPMLQLSPDLTLWTSYPQGQAKYEVQCYFKVAGL